MKLFNIISKDLAIDLGTANTLVYKVDSGVVLNESSSVAIDIRNGDVIAIGNKAKEMIGKTPDFIRIVKPLENGTISDFDITRILLKYCMEKAVPNFTLVQPKVIITAPANVSDIEIRAIEDACIYSGAREVYIIESAISSAIGGGINLSDTNGRMIVNLGAGNIEIAIVNLNGIVISKNLNFGGDRLDSDIINYIYNKYSVKIGENTANKLKDKLATVDEIKEDISEEVSGRDMKTGMPKNIEIFASDIKDSIMHRINIIVDAIKSVLEKNPPELSRDILENGIFLTGGLSKLKGLDKVLYEEIGVKINKSNTPEEDSVNGAGEVISDLTKYTGSRK